MTTACPICTSTATEQFFSLAAQPVLIGTLWPTAEAARSCAKGDISLRFCDTCGFVWNEVFDPGLFDYDQSYDNSLHFSPTFQNYSEALADRLIETHGIRGKTVVDIGCGKGDFLIMLCTKGDNRGFGFDPSFEGDRPQTDLGDRITWSNEYFSPDHARLKADLIASRFVFEHIPDPRAFLEMIRQSLPENAIVFFEVPDIDLIVRQGSVWDIIYEHCSYFSKESLGRVFEECGFDVLRLEQTYGKQYVTIEARLGDAPTPRQMPGLSQLRSDVHNFAARQQAKRETWSSTLNDWNKEGRNVVAWGAGAKAVGLFNMVDAASMIDRVVDINTHKHGKYLSGTGQRIIQPDDLLEDPPDTVIVMNPLYRGEIEETLATLQITPVLVEA